jgi:SAM-dependent methyltransferase
MTCTRVSGSAIATGVAVVCPLCRTRTLDRRGGTIVCGACGRKFAIRDGFADLIVGDRFEDRTSDAVLRSEEASSRDTVLNYWIPLFDRLWPGRSPPPRILSVGCGVGVDVDTLASHGFDSVGIDSGSRTRSWTKRREPDRLVMANGAKLPFEDGTFDAVFCGCVYPHVGVVGDSVHVAPTYRTDRLALATEMVRVLKEGGRIFASGANRRCPIDLFHGREPGEYVLRANPPWSSFLLAVGDYRRLFEAAGAVNARALPVHGYWGFLSSRTTRKGRLLSLPVRAVFRLLSNPVLACLRGSIIDPWIVIAAEKAPFKSPSVPRLP